jgi:two-component system nitrate/nitrite response regulator NarL
MAELFAGIRTLRSRIPKAKCIVLSPRTDPPLLRQALDAGADGLLLEDTPAEVLQLLTRLMLLGHPYVPTQVARAMYQGATQTNVERAPDRSASVCRSGEGAVSVEANDDSAPKPVSPPVMVSSIVITPQDLATPSGEPLSKIDLSGREKEILGCLVSGHSNKVIARQLDIAEATVKIHVKGLLRKMQVSNRTQAAVRALRYPALPAVPSTF